MAKFILSVRENNTFSHMVLIVIDINGVLGDVRKRSAVSVNHRTPEVILPNGQRFYARYDLGGFMHACYRYGDVALWTSRKEINAAPIEQYLEYCGYLHTKTPRLHGEDCKSIVNYHPIKDVYLLRTKYPQYDNEHIIFVDDSPNRIIIDANSEVVAVNTYNAARERTIDRDLASALRKIYHIVNV